MKQGWTKIGTICNIRTGKLDANAASENGAYPFFTCAEKPLRIDSYSYDDECILIAGNGDLNVKYYKGKFDAYQRTYILTLKENVNNIFLPYIYNFFLKYITHLRIQSIGGIIKYIRLGNLTEAEVHIPDLSKQQQIVAELDLLSGMIEKQKAQIEELNKLAQSIFYDMFGDPVTNEKGWEVKKLKEICSKITDGTHNSPTNDAYGAYMYITAKNIKESGLSLDNITYVSEEVHRSIYERCNPVYGDVLYIKDGATTGIAVVNNLKEEFSLLSSVALLKPGPQLVNQYLKAVLNNPSEYKCIRSNMGGAAITRLTIKKIEGIEIPLPPLSLQQEFAAKIEAIEAMKAKVRQSLKESETLFNSRMDYYFN